MQTTFMTSAKLPVSRIGLGCVTFGREIDAAASHALLDHAYERGVRMFDTAQAYSDGASERILGAWLASRGLPSGAVTVSTKILPPYEPARIALAVDESILRLGVAQIDLLYLHSWDASAHSLEALVSFDALVKAGFVRTIGASNFSLPQLQKALELQQRHGLTRFSVVQNNNNLAVSDVSPAFCAFCAEENVAIVTYSPLGAGFLTGKHKAGVAPGSRFDRIPGHQNIYFKDESYHRLARLEFVASRTGLSPSHLALAWALHQSQIASVLIGGRTTAHIDQAFAAQIFDDEAVLSELGALML